jgi:glycosyltransferase involved in cell wall biosynthesis
VTRKATAIERVLQVHTRYREPGGEDRVVDAERDLLAAAGISVRQVIFDNADLREGRGRLDDLRLAASSVWSTAARRRVLADITAFRPNVMHVHNTFVAASPSVYSAAYEAGVPVVQTLHNYRLVCPKATVFRDGHPCTDCVGLPAPVPAIVHACVRDSRSQSVVAVATMTGHRLRRTYRRDVQAYVALTHFQRDLLVKGGVPRGRIRVIPNFLEPDPGAGTGPRSGLLFVGRLSEEKGIQALLVAARSVPGVISVVGDGPLVGLVREAAAQGLVEYLGRLSSAQVGERIAAAVALLLPSTWYEGLPMVLLEAFARGTPVVASRIGSLAELVEHGRTGLLAEAGDAADLARQMRWALDNAADLERMGSEARHQYEHRYRGVAHLTSLCGIYASALFQRHTPTG